MTSLSTRLCVAACVLTAGTSFAQTKADGLWRGTAGAALSATKGNSEATNLVVNGDMAVATTTDKLSLGGAYNYGRGKTAGVSTTTSDKWNGFGQYDYNLSAQLYTFGKLSLEGDRLAKLTLRATLAGGLGYKLIDTKETSFNVFGGAAYSTDKYSATQTIGGDTGKRFSRASLYLGEESSHTVSASTSFKQRLELYPGLSGDKALLAKFTAGLAVAMSNTMSLAVGLKVDHNSKPPAGFKSNDVGVFTGINVKLGSL
jgi:putative salt-induced outer membrane protein